MLLPHGDPAALRAWCGADDPDLRALTAAAPLLHALFLLTEAQGATVVGAVFDAAGDRVSATGAGANRRAALGGCLGEAVETLSQLPQPGDVVARGSRTAPPPGAAPGFAGRLTTADAVGWTRAVRLPDGAAGLVPAPLALRGLAGGDGAPASLGCAAGRTRDAAIRAAVLELAEREALAAWRAGRGAARRLRGGGALEGVRMARIDDGAGPAVVVAASARAEASAAGESETEAAAGALRELAAADAAARLAAARGYCGPAPAPFAPPAAPPYETACGGIGAFLSRRADAGRPVWIVDVTRPDPGVAVVKALAPGPPSD
jgi:ribosomal protein S12 methylthiotransferase accessory factor YcaO